MYIVVTEAYLAALPADTTGPLVGERLDNGDVVRLLDFGDGPRTEVGRWWRGQAPDSAGTPGAVRAVLDETGVRFAVWSAGAGWVAHPHEVLHVHADAFARQQGLFDSAALVRKRVAIIGLGTGGSLVASLLTKAGVGHLRLVDFDRLAVHNVSRHLCGIRDLGRLKVEAVRDHLLNYSPIVQIETHATDVTQDRAALARVVAGCDVVIGATDSEEAKGFLNREAWAAAVPAVYGSVYNMGNGGDVFVAQPPEGACYECFRNATADVFAAQPKPAISDYGKIAPQPALELDASMIAAIVARRALTLLLRDDPTAQIAAYPTNWVIWGNQPWDGWLFDEPLQSAFVAIPPDPVCPVCHHDAYVRQTLHRSESEIAAEVRALRDSLPTRDEALALARHDLRRARP